LLRHGFDSFHRIRAPVCPRSRRILIVAKLTNDGFELLYPAKLVDRKILARFMSTLYADAMQDPNVHFRKAVLPDRKIIAWAKWSLHPDGNESVPTPQPASFYPHGANTPLLNSLFDGAYAATQRVMKGRPYGC
jgi:hypothetical protein